MENGNKKIQFIPIKNLEGRKFVVKDYQRGYKWEREQIQALLDDINFHEQGKYCLQPLIVKSDGAVLELIDGQQRITSIYILTYFLSGSQFCELDYQTRSETREFLIENLPLLDISTSINGDEFCRENPTYDNVDVFHFFEVYHEIKKWFANKTEEDKGKFLEKLREQVHVIWYDVLDQDNEQEAEDIFLNLNAGKIPLTNSELIKALFILDLKRNVTPEIAKLKAFELANEWDRIETRLHDNAFWYFLCDREYYKQLPTRIDLIIDLANELLVIKPEQDSKRSYARYEELYRAGKKLDWENILKTFYKLEEWYQDKELYHYIGFLIVSGIKPLSAIIALSKNKTKEIFKSSLVDLIKSELARTETVDGKSIHIFGLDQLDYSVNRKRCEAILLLFNIEYFLRESSDNRFPFDLYKEEQWSVEHINPQNPREFQDIQSLIDWLTSFQDYFEKEGDQDLLLRTRSILMFFESVTDKSQKVSSARLSSEDRVAFSEFVEEITSRMELHKIGNLCLLDKNTNSKLGNRVFLSKRAEVLNLYYNSKAKDVFIPAGTRDVFTKSFPSTEPSLGHTFFGLKDMEKYQTFIQNRLQTYLPTK